MIDSKDVDYFRARAQEERALGETTADPAVALIHLNLAQRYERLVVRGTRSRPTLHIAVSAPDQSAGSMQAQP